MKMSSLFPDWIYQKTNGETSYVYYEKDDIEDWFIGFGKTISNARICDWIIQIAWFYGQLEQASLIFRASVM